MKKISVILSILIPVISFSQDSALTYSRILKFDSLSKDEIFDKALIWCSKHFEYGSKHAIDVQERNSGIIAGKATYENKYKIPSKKDSVWMFSQFTNYRFSWLIEIKDGKLRFTTNNIEVIEENTPGYADHTYYPGIDKQPVFLMQAKSKTKLYWELSQQYFIKNMDDLISSLNNDLVAKKSDW